MLRIKCGKDLVGCWSERREEDTGFNGEREKMSEHTAMASTSTKINKVSAMPINSGENYPVPEGANLERRGTLISFIASSTSLLPEAYMTQHASVKPSTLSLWEDLKPLADSDIVQVRQISDPLEKFINVPNKYQVLISNGVVQFDVVETTDGVTRRLFKSSQPFTMKVLNGRQECIFELVGDPGIGGLGAFVKVKHGCTVLGKVVQINPLFACCNFSPSYSVQDESGSPICKIIWTRGRLASCMFTNDFQVYSADKKLGLIGTISRQTEGTPFGEISQTDVYKLAFRDESIERLERALLVAAVIMLDFQFFEGREGSHMTKLCICGVVFILVILIALAVIIYFLL